MATCPSQIDEHRLELSFGSHPGAGVSTSHYPAHVLPSVITVTVISTGSAMGYLHQASLMYILRLRPKMKYVFCRCVWLCSDRSRVKSCGKMKQMLN